MTGQNDIRDDGILAIIKESPTLSDWEIFLKDLLIGKYEYVVDKIGAQELIVELINRADNPTQSEYTFKQALRNVVQEWQPTILDDSEFSLLMLNIIGSYTPSEGFIKVINFLRRIDINDIYQYPIELKTKLEKIISKALLVIKRYFPVSPPDADKMPAFQIYVDMLCQYTQYPQFRIHVLNRLLELKVIPFQRAKLLSFVRDDRTFLHDIIEIILDLWQKKEDYEHLLSSLYLCCLELGGSAEKNFFKLFNSNGFTLSESEKELFLISRHTKEKMYIRLDNADWRIHLERKWNAMNRHQRKILNKVLTKEYAAGES